MLANIRVNDQLICGIDRRNSPEKIARAYNDKQGATRAFIMHGLTHINDIFNENVFDSTKFDYFSVYNEHLGRHEAYYKSSQKQSICIDGEVIQIEQNELINVEYSYKYSLKETCDLANDAGFETTDFWTDSQNTFGLHLLTKKVRLFLNQQQLACASLENFNELWRKWDEVTSLIGDSHADFLRKPIPLRHPYIFYMGHIPLFVDTALDKYFGTKPHVYSLYFARGIDPDTNVPSRCHTHSQVPKEWPQITAINTYKFSVRERVRRLKWTDLCKRLQRILAMSYEHELMHLETLLQMAVQDQHLSKPAGQLELGRYECGVPECKWVNVPAATFIVGVDDVEVDDSLNIVGATHVFAWDNEKPPTQKTVDSFSIQHRNVTIGEYLLFLAKTGFAAWLVPASWMQVGTDYRVKSLFGLLEMERCSMWPVYCSARQAQSYCDSFGCRLPTENEVTHLIQTHPQKQALAMHLHPNAVQAYNAAAPFADLNSNGFELTSTPFAVYAGYVPSELYPGYSSDFCGGTHLVVVGSSWVSRRAGLRNWYQPGYLYAFTSFRMCKNQY